MNILDRYVLRSFFFNLILWFFCIIGIFVVFDLFTNLDTLLKVGKEAHNVPKVIFLFYLFKSIPIAMMVSSILGLVSAMVTVAMMMRQNELVPIQAAGVSTIRIITPLIWAVIFVAVITTLVRETVLPNYLNELVVEPQNITQDNGVIVNATLDSETGITIQGDRTFQKELRISNPSFVLHKPLVKRTMYLKGTNAFHRPAEPGRPAGFLLVDVQDQKDFLAGPSLKYEEKPIVITTKDAPDWINPNECFVVSNVPFPYLASNDAWKQYASTWELFQAARNQSLDIGTRIQATIHSRLLQPVLDITLLFLGLPFILVNGDRNVFKAMGLSGILILFFFVVRESCQYLGTNAEMPVLGAWLPLMIFAPIAFNQFLKLKTC